MATDAGKPAVQARPVEVKLPPAAGRPDGKGLESITRGEGEPEIRRVVVPTLARGKR